MCSIHIPELAWLVVSIFIIIIIRARILIRKCEGTDARSKKGDVDGLGPVLLSSAQFLKPLSNYCTKMRLHFGGRCAIFFGLAPLLVGA